MDPRLKNPFSAIVVGPSGWGKSHFVMRFIENTKDMCDVH